VTIEREWVYLTARINPHIVDNLRSDILIMAKIDLFKSEAKKIL